MVGRVVEPSQPLEAPGGEHEVEAGGGFQPAYTFIGGKYNASVGEGVIRYVKDGVEHVGFFDEKYVPVLEWIGLRRRPLRTLSFYVGGTTDT